MESNAIKAITIGAGVLIAIATISLVMTYYNTAKEGMSAVGDGNNVYEQYERSIRDILTKTNIYGTDLINAYNYFGDNPSIKFTVTKGKITYSNDNIKDMKKYIASVMPNEKFILNVNDDVTEITVTAID